MSRLTLARFYVPVCFLIPLSFALGGTALLAQQADLLAAMHAYADLILYNGKVLTADDKFTITQAVAVRDGKILSVGDTALIQKMAGPSTVQIDLKGGTVTPGFIDSHSGGSQGGHGPSGPTYMKNYTALRCEALDDCLRQTKTAVAKAPAGEWVFVNPFRTAAAYQLNIQLLDQLAPNQPLLVTLDNTTGFVNSKAFAYLKDYLSDEVVQAGIFRDKSGQPNGRIAGGAYGAMTYEIIPWPEGQHLEDLIQKEIKREKFINRMGVTSLGARHSGLAISILREIQRRGQMPVRIRVSTEFMRLNPRTEAYLKRLGNLMDVGDEWFKISGATVSSIDGIPTAGGNLTRKPMRQLETWYAFGAYGQNKWRDMVVEGKDWKQYSDYNSALLTGKYGWNVSDFHILGDGGVELALEVFDKINQTTPVKGKHFGMVHGLMRPPDLAKRLAGYDAVLSMNQTIFRGSTATLEKQYGADAVAGFLPIRELIEIGLKPVMEVTNIAGWRGGGPTGSGGQGGAGTFLDDQNLYLQSMQLFVTRKNIDTGKVLGPHLKATREDVLRMATAWAARFSGDEKILGTIEPGKLADLVVLGGDYMTVPEEKIADLPILKVIVGGKVTYDRDRDEARMLEELKKGASSSSAPM
ncbi:MAG: amidohydrolase family protein [Acidobacteria bacterium]|nr:amidohydrolase family protein [Acidobacteriota bacterium]